MGLPVIATKRYVLERMGHAMPEDLPRFAEALEEATVSSVDATFPDVKPALAALKEQGHRLFLSTNANRSNAESALFGGGIREFFDGLLMLETARAKKDRPYYWRRAFEHAATDPAQAVVVDDVPKFLAPPAMMGATCFHLVRSGESPGLSSFPVIGSLDSLCARIR